MAGKRHCEVCNVGVTSLMQLSQHIQGKKHKFHRAQKPPEQLKLLNKLEYVLDKHVPDDPILGLEQVQEMATDSSFLYTCVMCSMHGDSDAMFAHLLDTDHMALYIQMQYPDMAVQPDTFSSFAEYHRVLLETAVKISDNFGRKKIVVKEPFVDCEPLQLQQASVGNKNGKPIKVAKSTKAKPLAGAKNNKPVKTTKSAQVERLTGAKKSKLIKADGSARGEPSISKENPQQSKDVRKGSRERSPPSFGHSSMREGSRERLTPQSGRCSDRQRSPLYFGCHNVQDRHSPHGERSLTPPCTSRGLGREEHFRYKERTPQYSELEPQSSRFDELTAAKELEFNTNEDFLEYLRKFEINNDEDASYIQQIIQNCTTALLRFREELSMGKAPPRLQTAPRPQVAPASHAVQRTPDVFLPRTDYSLLESRMFLPKQTFAPALTAAPTPYFNLAPPMPAFVPPMAALNPATPTHAFFAPSTTPLNTAPDFAPNPMLTPASHPIMETFPRNAATEVFFSSIKNMNESDVVLAFQSIAATNPAFQGIDIPSVIGYLKATGMIKSS